MIDWDFVIIELLAEEKEEYKIRGECRHIPLRFVSMRSEVSRLGVC